MRIFGYVCTLSHYCYPWKPGFELPADCPALSRIRAKLHHGYALAMVTLPKRCCGSVLSPWLLINSPSVVWSLQICSLSNISLQAGRSYNLSVPSLLDLVQWVVSFQQSDWSKTSSNCAAQHSVSVVPLQSQCFLLFFRHDTCSPGKNEKTLITAFLILRLCCAVFVVYHWIPAFGEILWKVQKS